MFIKCIDCGETKEQPPFGGLENRFSNQTIEGICSKCLAITKQTRKELADLTAIREPYGK